MSDSIQEHFCVAMVRERGQKKSYQQSLEDIKEKMKEKRSTRLSRASAASRGRSKLTISIAGCSRPQLLESVQENNRALALALEEEKARVRQAQGLILQMKGEQQALIFHLLLLKRKLEEQRAQGLSSVHEDASPLVRSPVRRVLLLQTLLSARQQPLPLALELEPLPLQIEPLPLALEPLPLELGPAQQSTLGPGLAPPPRPAPQQKRPAGGRGKAERGRKPLRKRPWDSAKPRGRSRSRDRPGAQRPAAAPPGDKLNASLGSNDTFDFDCEEAVHLTPFRAGGRPAGKGEGPAEQGAGPVEQGAGPSGVEGGASPSSSSPSSSSSEDQEDSLYLPYRRARGGAERPRAQTPPRRARSKRRSALQGAGPARDSAASPKPVAPCGSRGGGGGGRRSAVCSDGGFPETHRQTQRERTSARLLDKENQPGDNGVVPATPGPNMDVSEVFLSEFDHAPLTPGAESEVFLSGIGHASLTPGAESEVFLSDTPLRGFTAATCHPPVTTEKRRKGGRSGPCDVTNLSSAAFRKFSLSRPRPPSTDSAPGPARKRRCTITVDYKEPTLNLKLRRGDKFTDTKFLRSPIFKQKGRRSGKNTPTPRKYDEAFVCCH
ncbi:hypothetical protein AAFF_G00336820 [Aldrovandia affinis]|uniref:Shugoshin C-terminal domain-containing protein n=1 Tax=Aldrovandia affinis TaxID=143900 RepID=A0AAD7R6D2_9TELE|nr:hypothetical protein AAFF_G00336820 [Aldrovandia affinis]